MQNSIDRSEGLPEELKSFILPYPLHVAVITHHFKPSDARDKNSPSLPHNDDTGVAKYVADRGIKGVHTFFDKTLYEALLSFKVAKNMQKINVVIDNLLGAVIDLCAPYNNNYATNLLKIYPPYNTKYSKVYDHSIAYFLIKILNTSIIQKAFSVSHQKMWNYGQVHPYLIAVAEDVKQKHILEHLKRLFYADLQPAHQKLFSQHISSHVAACLQHSNLPKILEYRNSSSILDIKRWRKCFIDVLDTELFIDLLQDGKMTYSDIATASVSMINWMMDNQELVKMLSVNQNFISIVKDEAKNYKRI